MKKIALIALISFVGCSQSAQPLEDFLTDVINGRVDKDACTAYLDQLDSSPNLDQLFLAVNNNLSWADYLHDFILTNDRSKLIAVQVLKKLNEFRTHKLEPIELALLKGGENFCARVLRGSLFSTSCADTLEKWLTHDQDLKDRKLIPQNFVLKDHFLNGFTIAGKHILQDVPSLKLFPNINRVRLLLAPHVLEIAQDAVDENGVKEFVRLTLEHAEHHEPVFTNSVLINSELDVDVLAAGVQSLGTFIDESRKNAEQDFDQNQNNDTQKKVNIWKTISGAASINRSKKPSWAVHTTDQYYYSFINKVFDYLETGDENVYCNIQNYKIERPQFATPYIMYHDADTDLATMVSKLFVKNGSNLSKRIKKLAELLTGGQVVDYQGALSHDDYGKQVTGELLISLIKEQRYKGLAKNYYRRYKVDLSKVAYGDSTLKQHLKDHPNDPGCNRVNAVINPFPETVYKSDWTTNQKITFTTALACAGYFLYSQYAAAQDDADITAAV